MLLNSQLHLLLDQLLQLLRADDNHVVTDADNSLILLFQRIPSAMVIPPTDRVRLIWLGLMVHRAALVLHGLIVPR